MYVRLYWRYGGRGCLTSILPWLAALSVFLLMTILAVFFDYFPGDLWVSHRLQEIDARWFREALDWGENLADYPLVLIVWGSAILALWRLWLRPEAFLLASALLIRPVDFILKRVVDRPRPAADLVFVNDPPGDPSFPSGHVVGAVMVYGLLFYFAGVFLQDRRLRIAAQAACAYVIAFNAMERIYTGNHWFSDVYGGVLMAGLYLPILIWAHRHIFRRTLIRREFVG